MDGDNIPDQIKKGIHFFSRKYPDMKYIVYFQSYTNTHGRDPEELRALYDEALSHNDVVGIAIGTRPDTLPDNVLDMLSEINHVKPVFLEIGAETSNDTTLRLINRHHTWNDVTSAVTRAAARSIRCGVHLIAGLPGENRRQILTTVRDVCSLPIDTIKIHQLQILKGTILHDKWQNGEIDIIPFSLEEYIDLCVDILKIVPPHIVIERFLSQSPPEMVVVPKWGLKNYQFANLLERRLRERQ